MRDSNKSDFCYSAIAVIINIMSGTPECHLVFMSFRVFFSKQLNRYFQRSQQRSLLALNLLAVAPQDNH